VAWCFVDEMAEKDSDERVGFEGHVGGVGEFGRWDID
jgi:hypothetical protein